VWKGLPGERSWWWQVEFARPCPVGALLQIMGDDPLYLKNAPRRYVWKVSDDGRTWRELASTAITDERRAFRLHRLPEAVMARFLRLDIRQVRGSYPTLREVVFFADPAAKVAFPSWAVSVSTTGDDKLPGEAPKFLSLARSCKGREALQGQCVWLGDFDEAFVAAEPRPLCAFLSGNLIDWCQQNRTHWRGTQEVLQAGRLPLWASCGGAQGLAILAEVGVDKPWDCPHCRDPQNPKTPIYTHIGHTTRRPCGDYSGCRFERGPYVVRLVADDPVFRGLPREFKVMESHCGQIEWPPRGWMLVVTNGPGGLTKTQCLRVKDRYIYAAQFHIEMDGTPETSQVIMNNFLRLAEEWGGYNPRAEPVAMPLALSAEK
jgi:GMP synthase (glutamine-hydrolysing)